jgi:hypothetical protein
VQLQQFRKKKGKREPGKKADADAEAEEAAAARGEEDSTAPEPKSPVGLKLLAGEGGGGTPFEVEALVLQCWVGVWVLCVSLASAAAVVSLSVCPMLTCQCRKPRRRRRSNAMARGLVLWSPALWRMLTQCENRRRWLMALKRMMLVLLATRVFRSSGKAGQLMVMIQQSWRWILLLSVMELMMIAINSGNTSRWKWILSKSQQALIPKKLPRCQFLLKTLELITIMTKELKKW